MSTDPQAHVEALRVARFDREFGKIPRRESWLTLYLQLRDAGDDHRAAAETVKAEIQVANR